MARAASRNVPTSVILTEDQKAFIKKVAEKEERTFSHQLRYIISGWCAFHMKKKDSGNGKKGEEAGQKAQQEGQKGT